MSAEGLVVAPQAEALCVCRRANTIADEWSSREAVEQAAAHTWAPRERPKGFSVPRAAGSLWPRTQPLPSGSRFELRTRTHAGHARNLKLLKQRDVVWRPSLSMRRCPLLRTAS